MSASKRELKTSSPTALLLNEILDRHPDVQQKEIASDLGIGSSGNILTLFKRGSSKLPIKHIPGICKLLNEDPEPLLVTALSEYFPEIVEAMTYLKPEVVDKDEIRIVRQFRKAKEAALENLKDKRLAELKANALKEGKVLSQKEIRFAKEVSVKLSDDPKVTGKILNAFQSAFVDN